MYFFFTVGQKLKHIFAMAYRQNRNFTTLTMIAHISAKHRQFIWSTTTTTFTLLPIHSSSPPASSNDLIFALFVFNLFVYHTNDIENHIDWQSSLCALIVGGGVASLAAFSLCSSSFPLRLRLLEVLLELLAPYENEGKMCNDERTVS